MSFPHEPPNDSATWNPELGPPFDCAIDVSTHARLLNDAWSTESLEIISRQSSVFLQNSLDTTRNPVLMETIDNGFVQQSNVLYELPTTSILPSSYVFLFNFYNDVVFSNNGENDNLNSHNPVRESNFLMMDTIDFASARQEVDGELFGGTFEDDNMALDPPHANQNEELASHESSVWSSSNYYPSR
jgi:hypothetical protein